MTGSPATTNDAPAPAPSGSGVRVKPLDWFERHPRSWEARAVGLVYRVVDRQWWLDFANGPANPCESDDEAKAAAQADYEARILSALASDASPRGEAVAELNAVESAMLEIAQSEGPRGFVLLSPDQARDLIINAQAFCEARGIKVAAHPAPATVELLREALTRARADLMELVEGEQFLAPAIERIDAALAPATEGRKG